MKWLSFLLSLVVLTGCAHMTRQEWHEVFLGPRVNPFDTSQVLDRSKQNLRRIDYDYFTLVPRDESADHQNIDAVRAARGKF